MPRGPHPPGEAATLLLSVALWLPSVCPCEAPCSAWSIYQELTGTGLVTVPWASPALPGDPPLPLFLLVCLVPVAQGNLSHHCWLLALLSGFVTVKISVLCGFMGYFQGGGAQSLVTLLFSRNNGLIFWTETYHDSRVPRQWGTLSGLWVQPEVDDEPVGSALKRSGEPWPERRCLRTVVLRVSKTTRPMWNCLILWEFFLVFHFATLYLKLYRRASLLYYIISAHNCIEMEKLLLLSLVGHTGWAAGPRYLIWKAK